MFEKFKAKKACLLILCVLLFISTSTIAVASQSTTNYYDHGAGISFVIPAGWKQVSLNEEREVLDAKFCVNKQENPAIMYGSSDMWSALSEEEKLGTKRSDLDAIYLSEKDFAEAFGVSEEDVTKLYFNDIPYFKTITTYSKAYHSFTLDTTLVQISTIKNGWYFCYQLGGNYANPHYQALVELISSVDYGKHDVHKNATSGDFIGNQVFSIAISLVITILIYSVPIIVYRYAIKKAPIEKKKAKRITIVYAFIGFFVMAIFSFIIDGEVASGGAIFLWSFVNYKVLIGGKVKCEHPTETPPCIDSTECNIAPIAAMAETSPCPTPPVVVAQPPTDTTKTTDDQNISAVFEPRFCHKCGTAALADGIFCHRCGTKIVRD